MHLLAKLRGKVGGRVVVGVLLPLGCEQSGVRRLPEGTPPIGFAKLRQRVLSKSGVCLYHVVISSTHILPRKHYYAYSIISFSNSKTAGAINFACATLLGCP